MAGSTSSVINHSIRIECEFAGFALNVHFESHSCRQALHVNEFDVKQTI